MKSKFGIDAPYIVLGFIISGIICLSIALFMMPFVLHLWGTLLSVLFYFYGGYFLLNALWMLFSSIWGKGKVFQKMIKRMDIKGDEVVLDLGCGQGWFLTLIAPYLSKGRAIGLDSWQKKDLSRNSRDQVLSNLEKRKLNEKVDILDGDMRKIPLEDESIDVITASLSIHNLSNFDERKKVLAEISRVLKPNGRIVLMDFQKVQEYQEFFCQTLKWPDIDLSKKQWWMFPPTRILTVQKPQFLS